MTMLEGVYKQSGQADQLIPLKVTSDGTLAATGGSDPAVATSIGSQEDWVAGSDTDPASLIALVKRGLTKSTDIIDALYSVRTQTAYDGGTDESIRVEPLGIPKYQGAHQVNVTATNIFVPLDKTRISLKARYCDMRFEVAAVANATTSHFIEAGERLDIAIPPSTGIAVIRDSSSTINGKLEITELE